MNSISHLFLHGNGTTRIYSVLVAAAFKSLNKAAFIAQLDYWLSINESAGRESTHFVDNRWWTSRTYRQMSEESIWWSASAIRNWCAELTKSGILITREHRNDAGDLVGLWYSINYEALSLFVVAAVQQEPDKFRKMLGKKAASLVDTLLKIDIPPCQNLAYPPAKIWQDNITNKETKENPSSLADENPPIDANDLDAFLTAPAEVVFSGLDEATLEQVAKSMQSTAESEARKVAFADLHQTVCDLYQIGKEGESKKIAQYLFAETVFTKGKGKKGSTEDNAWNEHALREGLSAQDLRRFANWFRAKYGANTALPKVPEKLQSEIGGWRASIKKQPALVVDETPVDYLPEPLKMDMQTVRDMINKAKGGANE